MHLSSTRFWSTMKNPELSKRTDSAWIPPSNHISRVHAKLGNLSLHFSRLSFAQLHMYPASKQCIARTFVNMNQPLLETQWSIVQIVDVWRCISRVSSKAPVVYTKAKTLQTMSCNNAAIRVDPPMMRGKLTSTRPAALFPVGVEPLELDALEPWPPGLATLPWQV